MSDTQETMTTEAAAPEATPEKPKRGRSRKKAEEAPAPALAAEGAEAPAAPAKKTTRRRAAAKPADEAASPAATEAPTAEEAPKPRRTRARKTPEPAAEEGMAAATDAAPATSETSEEAPKPRRARTRKAASEPAADAEEKAPQAKEPEGAEASAAGAGKSEAPAPADAPESKEAPRRERTTTTVIRRRDREERRQNQSGQNGQGQGKNGQNKQNAQNSQGGKKNKKNRHENRNREPQPSVSKEELTELKVVDLRARAAEAGVDAAGLKKAELVDAIYEAVCKAEGFTEVTGVLDIMGDGYGFLRTSGYLPGENDIYVGLATIRKNGLRKGDMVTGTTRPARPNDKFAALQKVSAVNGMAPEIMALRPKFADLTPVFPDERLLMEHGKNTTTARVIDLTAPIGKGQRGLIVVAAQGRQDHRAQGHRRRHHGEQPGRAPHVPGHRRASRRGDRHGALHPRGGGLLHLRHALREPHPGGRARHRARQAPGRAGEGCRHPAGLHHALWPAPTTWRSPRAAASSPAASIPRPSIRPSASSAPPATSRTAARSPSSLRPCIETGSKMDEVIFEEFKGTGNMELKLDRYLADRRIFPAIDPISSGTRKEELLMDPQEAPLIWGVRRILANTNSTERAMDMLIKSLKQTNSNQEFLLRMAKKMQAQQGRADDGMEL